jgi:hypothetical protein
MTCRLCQVKEEALKIMKTIGEKFYLSPRNIVAVPIPAPAAAMAETTGASEEENAMQQASIRTDTEDEVVPVESPTVPHVGPLEAKVCNMLFYVILLLDCNRASMQLLKGSDGRIYALEFMRLTPRDANYVPENKGGTGLITQENLDSGNKSLRCVYILRQELISRYLEV